MKPLTILAAPINAVGHVNSVLGALKGFVSRGHRVIFILEEVFRGKAAAFGYEEHIIVFEKKKAEENPGDHIGARLVENKVLGHFSREELIGNIVKLIHNEDNYRDYKAFDDAIKETIKLYQPDLIYLDHCVVPPTLYYSGIPFINNASCTPIFFHDSDQIPPGGSGMFSSLTF